MISLGTLGAASRVAGGGEPSAGAPPNTYANLTFWYDGANGAHFQGNEANTATADTDGDLIQRTDSANSIARCICYPAAANPSDYALRKRSGVSGFNGLRIRPELTDWRFYVRPTTASVSPTVQTTLANMFAAGNKVIIALLRPHSFSAKSAVPWTDDSIISDIGGYFGLHAHTDGGTMYLQAYNYPSAEHTVRLPVTAGNWVVATLKHSGGQLRLRLNGGSWSQVASGNTGATGSPLQIQQNNDGVTTKNMDVDLAQMATYNAARTDAEILEVERWFGAKQGLTF